VDKAATAPGGSTGELELAYAGAAGQARLLAAGEVSPRELVELSLARIDATQSTLNCFRVLCAESALEQATEAERRIATGESAPLLGVPVAIKDDVDLAGHPTAFGCPGRFAPASEDCAMVAKLKAAGAIIVGKTNAPELGLWPFTEGPAFGATRNPWSLEHTPGGSSGGAAAAVAAGLVPAAIGSDGAGSVRIPAAWTNLIGIKPQRGRISTWPDPEAFNGLTVNGPLARTVTDAALLLGVLSGNVDGDLHRPPPPERPFGSAAAREPGPLRVALALNVPFSGAPASLDPRVRIALERIATRLDGLGHRVEEVEVPYGLWSGISFMPRGNGGVADWAKRVPDRSALDVRVRGSARHGRLLRPLMPLARHAEKVGHRALGRVFRRHDVVLTPTTAQPPLPIGAGEGLSSWETDKTIVAACPYAWPWNVLGWPGVNVPAGFVDCGLPVGAQLLGPANSEPLLLSLAAQLEQAAEGAWQSYPPLVA
jgi:amidase